MKRDVVLIAACMLLATTAFAGGQSDASAKGPVKQVLWSEVTGPKRDLQAKLGSEFQQKNPSYNITLEFMSHADLEKKLPTAIAAGAAPDIWSQSYRLVTSYKNNLSVLTEADVKFMGYASMKDFEDSWDPGALEQYSIGKDHYGVMFEYNLFGWGYNTEHFAAAGLDPSKGPKTWDDVINFGKKLTIKEGNRIKRQAVTFPYGSPSIWYFMEFQPMMEELGAPIMNKDGTETLINSDAAVKAITELKRRFDEGITDREISSTTEYMELCQNNQASMFIMNVIEWGTRYGLINPVLKGKIKAIQNPTFPGKESPSSVSSWGYSVNVNSKNKSWAWKLSDYLVKDPSRYLTEVGGLIPRKGWAQTEAAKVVPDPELVARMQKNTFPSGLLNKWSEVSEPIKTAVQSILYQGKDIKDTLNKAKATVDAAIK